MVQLWRRIGQHHFKGGDLSRLDRVELAQGHLNTDHFVAGVIVGSDDFRKLDGELVIVSDITHDMMPAGIVGEGAIVEELHTQGTLVRGLVVEAELVAGQTRGRIQRCQLEWRAAASFDNAQFGVG